jgi:hypothetical protein
MNARPVYPVAAEKEPDMKLLLVAALVLTLSALAGTGDRVAMGPDPGGHTGATVTPETTRTDNSAVDAARQAASGNRTETSKPDRDKPESAEKEK